MTEQYYLNSQGGSERALAFKDIDTMRLPIINIRRTSNMAIAPINIFGMAIGTFMLSCPMMEWCDIDSPVLSTCLFFGGLSEYIIGFYDWYQGKTLVSFIGFLFSFIHFTIYYSFSLAQYNIDKPWAYQGENRTCLMGTFFTMLLVTFLIILCAIYRKGYIYLINFGLLIISCIFLMIWQYNKNAGEDHGWAETTSGYCLFVESLSLLYTGSGMLINEIFQGDLMPLINPQL